MHLVCTYVPQFMAISLLVIIYLVGVAYKSQKGVDRYHGMYVCMYIPVLVLKTAKINRQLHHDLISSIF